MYNTTKKISDYWFLNFLTGPTFKTGCRLTGCHLTPLPVITSNMYVYVVRFITLISHYKAA